VIPSAWARSATKGFSLSSVVSVVSVVQLNATASRRR